MAKKNKAKKANNGHSVLSEKPSSGETEVLELQKSQDENSGTTVSDPSVSATIQGNLEANEPNVNSDLATPTNIESHVVTTHEPLASKQATSIEQEKGDVILDEVQELQKDQVSKEINKYEHTSTSVQIQRFENGEKTTTESQQEILPSDLTNKRSDQQVVIEQSTSNSSPKDHKLTSETPEPTPEPASEPVSEPSSEPTTEPLAIKSTKKRLTLKERLALAAKGKSKKVTDSANITPSVTPIGLTPVTSNDQETSLTAEETPIAVEETELSRLKKKLEEVQLKNLKLEEQVILLKTRSTSASMTSLSNSNDSDKQIKELKAKLATKDDTIQQLLKEGETLSVKELKLNETIKKLRVTNSNLEMNLKDYSEKTNETNLKIVELEDYLKTSNFKSISQLIDNYTQVSQTLAEVQSTLDAELECEWESKYRELLKRFENEVLTKKEALKDINELKIQLNMSKRQHTLELESKTSIINDLKREISSTKLENLHEIARLESKIESLRMETESSNPRGNSSLTFPQSEPEQTTSSKTIDYTEFEKLSDTHHNLQQQYLSSQANWKVIEANLLNKVDSSAASIEAMKRSKIKLSQDLKKLNSSLMEQAEENKKLHESSKHMLEVNEELKFAVQVKETDLLDLQDKLEKFKQIYSSQKANMDIKVQSLTATIDTLKSENNCSQTSLKKFQEGGLHLSLDTPIKQTFRGISSQNVAESGGQFHTPSWNDIRLGESSNTPAANFSTFPYTSSMDNSVNSLSGDDDPLGNLTDDAYSLNSRHHSFSHNNSHISSTIPAIGNNSNIHLINKMSSNIRRLEIELHTLREENHQFALEKEETEQKLLDKLKLSDEVASLNRTIEDLQQQIHSNNEKEQTMLELIGEKSEQVEELKADIVDLKGLCKLQVQQMMDLQESKI